MVGGKNPNFEIGKTRLKDFFDKPWPEVAKDWIKKVMSDKLEKIEKLEKNEKIEKPEKLEKREKLEQIEVREQVFDPGLISGPDPRLEQLVRW